MSKKNIQNPMVLKICGPMKSTQQQTVGIMSSLWWNVHTLRSIYLFCHESHSTASGIMKKTLHHSKNTVLHVYLMIRYDYIYIYSIYIYIYHPLTHHSKYIVLKYVEIWNLYRVEGPTPGPQPRRLSGTRGPVLAGKLAANARRLPEQSKATTAGICTKSPRWENYPSGNLT